MNDLETKSINGREAQYILEHPVFNKAFTDLRDSLIAQMRAVKPRDRDMHTRLIDRLQTLDGVEQALRKTIETGKLAYKEMKYQKSFLQRVSDFTGVSRN
jgi:hypothetical protein